MRKLKLIYISKGAPEQKRRHFVEDISLSKEFSRMKDLYTYKKITEVCSKGFCWQQSNFGSGNGLAFFFKSSQVK